VLSALNFMFTLHGRYIPDNETLFRKMEEITTESMNEKIKKKRYNKEDRKLH